MDNLQDIAMVAIVAAVTILLRFLPFWIFGENRTTPPLIAHLGQVLPFAIMGMLVVYCLKDTAFTAAPFGIPELCCCALVAALHVWTSMSARHILGLEKVPRVGLFAH